MKNSSIASGFLPVLLLVLQTYILLTVTIFFLHRVKLLKKPYPGMEYSEALLSGAFLLGVMLVSLTDTAPALQSFTIYQNSGTAVWDKTLLKFSQYFTISFLAVCLFVLFSYFNLQFFFNKTFARDTKDRDLPSAILATVITIGFSLLTRAIIEHWLDMLTPKAFNFNNN